MLRITDDHRKILAASLTEGINVFIGRVVYYIDVTDEKKLGYILDDFTFCGTVNVNSQLHALYIANNDL